MDVSVIIVNFNTQSMTKDCIDSIIKHTSGLTYEIIVVDNASTDGSNEFFEKDGRIKYIYSTKNLGFGGANNLGVRNATGRFLFLLNSDTLLVENSIKILYDYLSSQDSIIACGAQLIYPNGEYQQSEIHFPNLIHDLIEIIPATFRYNFSKNRSIKYKINNIKIVEVVSGANIFIDHLIYNEANGFDEDYFMYFEETDLFYRLNRRGYKSCVIPYTKIIHINGGSFKNKKSNKRIIMQYKSKILFYKKNMSNIIQQMGKLILTISVFIRIYSFRDSLKNALKAIWG